MLEEVEDLGLDGDVEGGDGFVGDDEFRLWGEGAGDGDALALAAGELVGVLAHEAAVEADALHEFGDGGIECGAGEVRVTGADGFGEGAEDGHARVQGRVGILEDHLEVEAEGADLLRVQRGEVDPVEHHGTGRWRG